MKAPSPLSSPEVTRYSRHLLLPQFGLQGQKRLKQARVLCIGAGGLGSPAALYLAAAGVGTLGIVDFDDVDISNLQRQVIHRTADVGTPKTDSAARQLKALNPEIAVRTHALRLSSLNALELFAQYDLVLDGSDTYATRYLINDAAILTRVPLVSASVFRFEGQVSVFGVPGGPCYRCLYPEPPPAHLSPSCGEGGVLGAVTGVVGTIQATEVIKVLAGIGEPLVGRLLLFDALEMQFRELKFRRDPECAVCSERPTVTTLGDYEAFCGVTPLVVPLITPAELFALLKVGQKLQLVDVREPLEREINGLRGALAIPMGELESRLLELDPQLDTVMICKVGDRSASAVKVAQRLGLSRVRNLEGGIEAWLDEVDDDQFRY